MPYLLGQLVLLLHPPVRRTVRFCGARDGRGTRLTADLQSGNISYMSNYHTSSKTRTKRIGLPKPKVSSRKERVTFTLSQDSLAFIQRTKEAHNSSSLSATLDRMIEGVMRARALDALNANVAAYYDSLSPTEMQEETAWGEVGAEGLAAFESESEMKTSEPARMQR